MSDTRFYAVRKKFRGSQMKERFAGKVCTDIDALSAYITQVVEGLGNGIILSLASPEWVMEVVHAQLLT